MLVAGGLHPYSVERRQIVLSRAKPREAGILPSLALALLLITGFAYGLRAIDRRFAAPASSEPSRVRSFQAPTLQQMSA